MRSGLSLINQRVHLNDTHNTHVGQAGCQTDLNSQMGPMKLSEVELSRAMLLPTTLCKPLDDQSPQDGA